MEQTEIVGRIVSIPLSRAQECNTDHLTVALERQAYLSLRFLHLNNGLVQPPILLFPRHHLHLTQHQHIHRLVRHGHKRVA